MQNQKRINKKNNFKAALPQAYSKLGHGIELLKHTEQTACL